MNIQRIQELACKEVFDTPGPTNRKKTVLCLYIQMAFLLGGKNEIAPKEEVNRCECGKVIPAYLKWCSLTCCDEVHDDELEV